MNSENVLSFFKEITKIPRESGHEEHIIAYLQDFAAQRGLECKTDEAGNVLIVKEAAAGYEEVPVIVLQSHSDMVCEKNEGVEHDFAKDPIRYVIENGWMIAPDTTLGADCGIGIAAQLALLDSDMPCGKIECLFTTSEETGLDGAMALQPGFFSGKVLLNLVEKGDVFNAAAVFFSEGDAFGTVVAKTKCEILFISRERLEKLIEGDFAIASAYISLLSEKIHFLNRKIAAFTARRADAALAGFLMDRLADGETMTVNMSRLASALDIGRTTLYRAMDMLAGEGAIAYDGKEIKILSRELLEKRFNQ